MKTSALSSVVLFTLFACSSGRQETTSAIDSTGVDSVVRTAENDLEDEHGGVGGPQLNIVVNNTVMYSDVGMGDETILSTETFSPQILEKGAFQFLNGKPDYWYKIRLENGKEGWVFGANTSLQYPTDQTWKNLYNDFARAYDIPMVEPDGETAYGVDVIVKKQSDDVYYVLMFDTQDGDVSTVYLVVVNQAGHKSFSNKITGVFELFENNKKFKVDEMYICFSVGNWKLENGVQKLDAQRNCFELQGNHLMEYLEE